VIGARPTARFVVAGSADDPQLEAELRELARPLNGAVTFIGPVEDDDKWELLHRASVLLFPPTESEGHPRVVLEAIAAGLPVVATDQGGIAETIVDGESGFVLSGADPQALAERVLALLQDEDLRKRVGAAARERYLQEFTQDRADERIARWLEDVAVRTNLLTAEPSRHRIASR
jgi:glycosyltransferase involved in cell wall biosynthesis